MHSGFKINGKPIESLLVPELSLEIRKRGGRIKSNAVKEQIYRQLLELLENEKIEAEESKKNIINYQNIPNNITYQNNPINLNYQNSNSNPNNYSNSNPNLYYTNNNNPPQYLSSSSSPIITPNRSSITPSSSSPLTQSRNKQLNIVGEKRNLVLQEELETVESSSSEDSESNQVAASNNIKKRKNNNSRISKRSRLEKEAESDPSKDTLIDKEENEENEQDNGSNENQYDSDNQINLSHQENKDSYNLMETDSSEDNDSSESEDEYQEDQKSEDETTSDSNDIENENINSLESSNSDDEENSLIDSEDHNETDFANYDNNGPAGIYDFDDDSDDDSDLSIDGYSINEITNDENGNQIFIHYQINSVSGNQDKLSINPNEIENKFLNNCISSLLEKVHPNIGNLGREYVRFMILKILENDFNPNSQSKLIPPPYVYDLWSLHILSTTKYDEFQKNLQFKIPHDPDNFTDHISIIRDKYSKTIESYIKFFNLNPTDKYPEIWINPNDLLSNKQYNRKSKKIFVK